MQFRTNERILLQQFNAYEVILSHGNEFETKHLILHSPRVIERLYELKWQKTCTHIHLQIRILCVIVCSGLN